MACKVTREEFQPMEPEEVDRALAPASLAKYMLDLYPSWFIMAVWKGMYDLVWMLVNSSLKEGVILLTLKEAVVYPLFKGLPLNPTRLDSFCPVSHIPFLGKVVERVVAWQRKRTLNEADYQII